jgi:hypothetical protein
MTDLRVEIEDSLPVATHCDDDFLHVTLADGAAPRTALWRCPRLAGASSTARNIIEFTPLGMHWLQIDEDISRASMPRGEKAPGATPPRAAD